MHAFYLLHCEDWMGNAVYVRDHHQTLTLQTAVSDFPDPWETHLYCLYITMPNVWYSRRNKLRWVCRNGRSEEAWRVDLTSGLTSKGWTVRDTNLSRILWQKKREKKFSDKGAAFLKRRQVRRNNTAYQSQKIRTRWDLDSGSLLYSTLKTNRERGLWTNGTIFAP